MSSNYNGYFMVVNNWAGADSIIVSVTHYKGSDTSGELTNQTLAFGQASNPVEISANSSDSDYWTATVTVGYDTYSCTKYEAGFKPEDADHIVVLTMVDMGSRDNPEMLMCFPFSDYDSTSLKS